MIFLLIRIFCVCSNHFFFSCSRFEPCVLFRGLTHFEWCQYLNHVFSIIRLTMSEKRRETREKTDSLEYHWSTYDTIPRLTIGLSHSTYTHPAEYKKARPSRTIEKIVKGYEQMKTVRYGSSHVLRIRMRRKDIVTKRKLSSNVANIQ